ncbi:MAG: PepSY-associated TM helix domain-containing protein [Parasphingopyxis sp.]|uniref:PepSY-associated TM helix domain-containing protein n=1 Tax=Parasphingopyxis sp. TaxID=1920299 RepID=UPI003F9EE1E2
MASVADTVDIGAPESRRPRVRRGRLWFRIHGFVGITLSLLFGFICLTGTLAVFADEIDWLIKPQIRASAVVPAAELPWEAMAVALAEHAPENAVETFEAGSSPIFAPAAYIYLPGGEMRVVYFDSETGAVQGEGALLSTKALLRGIHSRLLLRDPLGTTLVSLLSVFLLISLVTALLVYKKWWRGLFRLPRRGRGRRAFWGDLHRLAGVWSLAFGLLMALTGLWYLTEEVAAPAPGFSAVSGTEDKVVNREAAALLPAALAMAREAYPDLSIRRITWPGSNGAAFGFYGQDGTLLVRPRANGVLVDAFGAKVLDRHSGGDGTLHQRISEAADPLHMGYFAGYWSKALWFVCGALMTLLAFSGVPVFLRRLAQDGGANGARGAEAASRWRWLNKRRGFGAGVILVAVAVFATLYFLPREIDMLY